MRAGLSVQEYWVNNVWSCTSSRPYDVMNCAGTTKCYIYQTVDTLSRYILTCVIFMTFFHFIHWELEMCLVSSSAQNIVVIK
jgi:hypothetical protein